MSWQGSKLVNPEYIGIFIIMHFAAPIHKYCFRLLVFLLFPVTLLAQSRTQVYVTKFRPLADSLSGSYGIPSSIILGISILESGSGTSRNARLLRNYFGIVGKNNLLKTHGIRTRYKQYANDLESFVDFCRLLTKKKYYASLKGKTSAQDWVNAIAAAGYSEMPSVWKQRVMATIKKQRL